VPAKQKWKAYVEVIVNRQALGIVTKYVSTTALGFHKEKYDAVRAVDRALIVLSGEGAVTNYPLSDYVSDMEQLEMWTIEELQEALRTELYKEKHQGPWRAGLAPDPKDICRSSGPLGLPYSNSPSKKLSELQLNKACNELAKPRRVFIEDSNGKIESCERPPLPWRILKDEVAAEQAATDAKIAEEGGRTLADALADIAAPSISTDKGKKKKGPWKAGSLSDPSVVDYNAPTRDHPKIRNIHAERATSIIKQALFQKSDIGHATCALCPVPCDLCLRQKMRRAFQKWRLVTFYELETPQPEWRVPGAAPDLDCVYLSSPLEPHVPLSPSWDTPRNV
jgi:predicted transcriptional regulator